ncbi:hypothetical protein N0V90_009723 [Kalmusia sp. IMI 367209]|nr:hypothetical protein N0V90_009723 [Kalmusia sp. IMI 367209]
MPTAQHDAIPGFTLIAPTVWERHPTLPINNHLTAESPSLIIILPWTGAHGRHVAKYTAAYEKIFPSSRLLCITTSTKDICLRSSKRKQDRLRPAVERILAYADNEDGNFDVVVHAFSEGGSNKAVELAEAYHNITSMRLPCSALCLDSTPGHPRYLRLCNALKKSLPPIPILNCTGLFVGSALLGGIWVLYRCFKGTENNVISRTRRRFQDPKYWNSTVPRCYLYSKGDELIAWQDIREHMGEAVRSGVPVMDVCFEGSAHCKHAAQDPERYWGAVSLTWKRTCINKEKRDSKLDVREVYEEKIVLSKKVMSVLGIQQVFVQ